MSEVRIAGAGVSGLTAAIELARNGFDVKVFESAGEVRGRESVSAIRNYSGGKNILEEIEGCGLDLTPNGKVMKVERHSKNHSSVTVGDEPIFYLFRRGERENALEGQLYKFAKESGVEFVFNFPNEEDADIIATGPKRKDFYGVGCNYDDLNMDEETVNIFYDNHYASKGYLFAIKTDEIATIGAVTFDRDFFKYLHHNFKFFLNKNEKAKELIDGVEKIKEISGFGNYNVPRTAVRNGRLYTGERAGFQDASKGFGIYYAIKSGYLAARSIVEDRDYDELWRSELKERMMSQYKRRIQINQMENSDYDRLLEMIGERNRVNSYTDKTRDLHPLINIVYPFHLAHHKIKRQGLLGLGE